jgi:hypothetical protein
MSDELDFSKLSLDDVKLGGEPTAEPTTTEGQTQGKTETGAEGAPDTGKSDSAKNDDSKSVIDTDKADTGKKESTDEKKVDDKKPETATYNFKDDFIKEAVEYYEKTGDLTPYLQAKLVDFNAMSDEEIMRRELREQYPDVSDKAFEKLFHQQVVDKFKLDSEAYDEDDTELGKELLKTEAAKLRSKYLDWQKGFKAPEPKADDNAAEAQRQAEETQAKLEAFAKSVKENEVTKSVLNDKRIAIKTTDGDFNYELTNPDGLLDVTLDNTKFFTQFLTGEGQVDYNKWYLTSAFAQDPEGFIKSIGNHFKGLGREEVAKEIKNPSNNSVGDIPTEGSGDFKSGLLQAFAQRGVSK